jgi:ATP-dependent Clp protease adapter protein ClpS
MSTQVDEKVEFIINQPKKYCNVFYNNDTTSFQDVMFLLVNAFKMDAAKSMLVTQQIDQAGKGIVHVNTKEVCEHMKEKVDELRNIIKEKDLLHQVEEYSEEEE